MCAYVLSLAKALIPNDTQLTKATLASICAEYVSKHTHTHTRGYQYDNNVDRCIGDVFSAERSLGVSLGGMDQAISFMAEKNMAKLIHFRPSVLAASVEIPKACMTQVVLHKQALSTD
jgi:galactokinase